MRDDDGGGSVKEIDLMTRSRDLYLEMAQRPSNSGRLGVKLTPLYLHMCTS